MFLDTHEAKNQLWLPEVRAIAGYGLHRPITATLLENKRITAADHFQDTRHIAFGFDDSSPEYKPGDILTVWPRQNEAAIGKVLQTFGLHARDVLTIGLHSRVDTHAGCQDAMKVAP